MDLVVKKWGNSAALRLPKNILEYLGVGYDDTVSYDFQDGKLVLEKVAVTDEERAIAFFNQLEEELFEGIKDIEAGRYQTADEVFSKYGL